MKRMRVILCAAIILGVIVTPTAAYRKMGDLMAEEGIEWIVGKWVLSPEPGFMKTIHLEWDLDRRIVRLSMTRPRDFKYLGIVTFNPSQKEMVGLGADTMGAMFKMVWRIEDATLVWTCVRIEEDGKSSKSDFVFTKVDSSTMKMDIHEIAEGDRRPSKPSATFTYKREAKKAPN